MCYLCIDCSADRMTNKSEFSWDLYTLPAYFSLPRDDKYFKAKILNTGIMDIKPNLPANLYNYNGECYLHCNGYDSFIVHKDEKKFYTNLLEILNQSRGVTEKRLHSLLDPRNIISPDIEVKRTKRSAVETSLDKSNASPQSRYNASPSQTANIPSQDEHMDIEIEDDALQTTTISNEYLEQFEMKHTKILKNLNSTLFNKPNLTELEKVRLLKKYYDENNTNHIEAIDLFERLLKDFTELSVESIQNDCKQILSTTNNKSEFCIVVLQTIGELEVDINGFLGFLQSHILHFTELANENIKLLYPKINMEYISSTKFLIYKILNQQRFNKIDQNTKISALIPVYKTLFYIEVLKRKGYSFDQLSDHNIFDFTFIDVELYNVYHRILTNDEFYKNLKLSKDNKSIQLDEPISHQFLDDLINKCVHYSLPDNEDFINLALQKYNNNLSHNAIDITEKIINRVVEEKHIITDDQWKTFVDKIIKNKLLKNQANIERVILKILINIIRNKIPQLNDYIANRVSIEDQIEIANYLNVFFHTIPFSFYKPELNKILNINTL